MSAASTPISKLLKWTRFQLGWFLIFAGLLVLVPVAFSALALIKSHPGLPAKSGNDLQGLLMDLFVGILLFFLGSSLRGMKPKVVLAPANAGEWCACIFGCLCTFAWIGATLALICASYAMSHIKEMGIPTATLASAHLGVWIFAGFALFSLIISTLLLNMVDKSTGPSLVAEAAAVQANQSVAVVPELATPKTQKRKAKRWASCNIIAVGAEARRLWSFTMGRNGFNVGQQATIPSAQSLPAKTVGRDWRNLFQRKLNVAWLPVEQVFLRVAQLPISDYDETLAMVELQLEKLSPLPVTQMVWSLHILPQHVDNLQTVIVIIVARDLVEKFLGELEGQGFLADRLELPILDEILATRITHDGAYVYPDTTTGKFSALVAWWYGGTLRNLGLVHVPAVENRDVLLKEQLAQMAWAGELEGWLSGTPRWHLVANETTAASWQPMFRPWLGQSAEVLPPLSETDLATRNANRAARETSAGILPSEYALRYAQEFHDRLWMRGLGAIVVAYLIWVVIYMAGAQWVGMKADDVEGRMRSLSREYTNTLQIKAQVDILQNRQALKFASLDCWKTTAELLPDGITIGSLEFRDGKTLNLSGTAPGDGNGRLTDFNEALRKKILPNGQPMFENVTLPTVRLNPGGASLSWSFNAVLANAEEPQ